MKRHLTLTTCLLIAAALLADSYTIVFNSGNADSSSKTSDLANIVLSATDNCAATVRRANNIYRAKPGFGIKGGTASAKGELTLGLNATYAVTTLTVYAACYGTDASKNNPVTVCGQTLTWDAEHKTEIYPYTFTFNSDLDSISIAATAAKNNRWYVQKIVFEAPDPRPNTAVFETLYSVDFGSMPIEEGEIAEDVVSLNISARHVVGEISLALQKGDVFSLGVDTLPAEGGEVDLAYRLSYTATENDILSVSGKGADNVPVTQTIPLKISGYRYTPPDFHVDSSCMAIGPMPGLYYEAAQGQSDSLLKARLGGIIFCGVRYKYGSGNRKTWDGFFHTDRDTLTHQVLDMYSDNIRYFDPAKPTASVPEFDIEHMLPKSWWGGTVNEAYCDLYHLVPGDYSANRSKSNHAPGVPTDTTFWNGSFATGNAHIQVNDTTVTTLKVFCPADEYKGDFARAYFYIAACYGDSLKWVESGESAHAMTNEGWQEFRPWLRDLLLSWHRSDPVSEKELTRAVEVNKIQGNRNPFIDYPELVEYIWGDKQGEAVDFNTLRQSYGDKYGDTTTGIGPSGARADGHAARKLWRNGQLVIIRNASIYTTLGQQIR